MPKVFRKQVFCCTTDGEGRCATKGGREVWMKFKEEMRNRGLTDIIVTQVGCTGQHTTGPTVIVHPDGLWYQTVKPEDVPEIIEKHIIGGKPVERLVNPEMRVKAD
jgi:(2Fe-2S) ferredoxin